MTEKKTKKYTK
ncbi:Protein of unknown function [Lactobacillus helveticus CIRM-BIA 101]|uniref:Uncharacterized protein n=1 Tax=Lactobacillus helveticus CIRM-BIA 104 TaxID=1226333 RepID=U6F853_LACHE|nr:Protein of unknown function [Lactobacillus helveticus CIRM-BIA 104]CDI64638.1 Protein of unknown function [Lactobacillus helveticus CIRM-BIA 101]